MLAHYTLCNIDKANVQQSTMKLVQFLETITLSTIICQVVSHEGKTCSADLECIDGGERKSVQIINIGELTPSSIIVIDNFLSNDLMMATFENITKAEWETVIPDHKKYYEKWKTQNVTKEGDNLEKWMKAPKQGGGGFPGIRTRLTEAYEKALRTKLDELDLEVMMGIESPLQGTWSSLDSFFGNVCYHPESLGIAHRAPHTDEGFIDKKLVKLAIVHYINPTFQGTGGTSFYRETSSGASRFLFQDCQAVKGKVKELGLTPGTTKYIEAVSCHCKFSPMDCSQYKWYGQRVQESKYTSSSTPHYELLMHVPYKFNSAVIYEAKQLHSAFIDDETLQHLTCDAKVGRLTANIFIV